MLFLSVDSNKEAEGNERSRFVGVSGECSTDRML